MTRRAGRVFVACAIGAWIGTFVALGAGAVLWWIGLIMGGLAGYLSYEGHEVIRAIPAAYRAARGWHSPPLFWKSVGLGALLWAGIAVDGFLLFLILGWFVPALYILALVTLPSCVFMFVIYTLIPFTQQRYTYAKGLDWQVAFNRETQWIVYWSTPPLLLFWHLPRGTVWVLRRTPAAARFVATGTAEVAAVILHFWGRFGWELFLRVHSEMRLLCGVDAALGTAVGYFAGSALVGAIAGGLFGLVNYALVTEAWLRRRNYLPTHG